MKSILILFLCIFLVGCGKDVVSRDEYDNVVQELENLRNDYDELEEKYDSENVENSEIKNNIILEKEYSIDNDTFLFSCIENNNEYSIIIICTVANKSNAFDTFTSLRMSTDIKFLEDKEIDNDTKKIIEGLSEITTFFINTDSSVSIMVSYPLGTISASKDREIINLDDYFSVEWITSEEYANNNYIEYVTNFYSDFIESLPTEVLESFLY